MFLKYARDLNPVTDFFEAIKPETAEEIIAKDQRKLFDKFRKAVIEEQKRKFDLAADLAAGKSAIAGAGLGLGVGTGSVGAYLIGDSMSGGHLGSRLWNLITNKGSNISRTDRVLNKLWRNRSVGGKAGRVLTPLALMLGGGAINGSMTRATSDDIRDFMFVDKKKSYKL